MNDHQKFHSDTNPQRDSEPAIMHLSACYKLVALSVVAVSILLLILVSHPTGLSAQPMVAPSAQVARFLQPPYYGTVGLNSVYDHEYPLYGAEANVDPENAFIITSTVRHYDGTRYWNLAYSGHNGSTMTWITHLFALQHLAMLPTPAGVTQLTIKLERDSTYVFATAITTTQSTAI